MSPAARDPSLGQHGLPSTRAGVHNGKVLSASRFNVFGKVEDERISYLLLTAGSAAKLFSVP